MTLDEYLREEGITPTAFGRRLPVAHTTVLRWISKEMEPSPPQVARIVQLTGGRVTAAELAPRAAAAAAVFLPPTAPVSGDPTPADNRKASAL